MELYGTASTFTRKKRLPKCRYEKSDKKIGCPSNEIIANVKEEKKGSEVYETYDRILIERRTGSSSRERKISMIRILQNYSHAHIDKKNKASLFYLIFT